MVTHVIYNVVRSMYMYITIYKSSRRRMFGRYDASWLRYWPTLLSLLPYPYFPMVTPRGLSKFHWIVLPQFTKDIALYKVRDIATIARGEEKTGIETVFRKIIGYGASPKTVFTCANRFNSICKNFLPTFSKKLSSCDHRTQLCKAR